MAAPSIRSQGTVTSASTAAPSFAEPAGAVSDDMIVCIWFQDDARTSVGTPPTGFLSAFDAPQANNPLTGSSPDHSLQVYLGRRSVVGAGPYTFTVVAGLGGATPFCEGRAVAVQDVPASVVYPFTEAADGNTSGSSSSATAPAVSATSADIDRLALYAATNWTGGAWTPASGYAEDWDANNQIITIDHLTMPTATTTSPQAVNASSDRTNAWVGIFPSSAAAAAAAVSGVQTLPPQLLYSLAARNQAMWQNGTDQQADATATPSTITGAAVVPAPTVTAQTNATATPSAVAGSAVVPAPTVTAASNATATPSAVVGSATVPSPTITAQSNATATPSTITGAAVVPAPAVSVGTNATAAPGVVTATVSIPTPTITAQSNATATPSAITGAAVVPAPTVTAATSRTATPGVVSATVSIATPAVTAVMNATIAMPTLARFVAIPPPTVIAAAAGVGVIGDIGDLDHDVPGALVLAPTYAVAGSVG